MVELNEENCYATVFSGYIPYSNYGSLIKEIPRQLIESFRNGKKNSEIKSREENGALGIYFEGEESNGDLCKIAVCCAQELVEKHLMLRDVICQDYGLLKDDLYSKIYIVGAASSEDYLNRTLVDIMKHIGFLHRNDEADDEELLEGMLEDIHSEFTSKNVQ